MFDKPISAGDLVYVAKATSCCNNDSDIGFTFTVKEVSRLAGSCAHCGEQKENSSVAYGDDNNGYAFCIARLKRIPPLEEKEEIEFLETIEA